MTRYHSVNVKFSASLQNKLRSATISPLDVTLILSLNIIGYGETNVSHRLLLTDRQIASFCKTFANTSSTNITF